MKKILGFVHFVLMFGFIALSFFNELFELTNTHLLILLIVISILLFFVTMYEYKKYNNRKVAFWNTVECIIFIITSLMETFEIIGFQTYVTITLIVDGVGFWLDEKLEDKKDQSGDGSKPLKKSD